MRKKRSSRRNASFHHTDGVKNACAYQQDRASSPAQAPGSAAPRQSCSRPKAQRWLSPRAATKNWIRWWRRSPPAAAKPWRSPATSRMKPSRSLWSRPQCVVRGPRHRLQQCRHARRNGTDAACFSGRLDRHDRDKSHQRLPGRQISNPGDAGSWRRLVDLHLQFRRLHRRHAGRCRLCGQQGGIDRPHPGARGRVRAQRHSRQCDLAGRHRHRGRPGR